MNYKDLLKNPGCKQCGATMIMITSSKGKHMECSKCNNKIVEKKEEKEKPKEEKKFNKW